METILNLEPSEIIIIYKSIRDIIQKARAGAESELDYWIQLRSEAKKVDSDLREGKSNETLNEQETSLNLSLIGSLITIISLKVVNFLDKT